MNTNGEADSPRTVAFYLPQFHQITENDGWWGEGFTEWTNVRRARPQFTGHRQPRVPSELGYYDLTNVSVLEQQAILATAHGIDAFCFYHYWFSGRRLLEAPVSTFLSSVTDIGFCLCWANENWSRRWDGKSSDVLMAQGYEPGFARELFMSCLPSLLDGRYLRYKGAAVLIVHRADHLPSPIDAAAEWRSLARTTGVGALHLLASETVWGTDPRTLGFDGVVEFPPVGANGLSAAHLVPVRGLDPAFNGRILSYNKLAARFTSRRDAAFVRHRGVMPGWDNSARRGARATIYVGSSPTAYARWLRAARTSEFQSRGPDGLVFVNAWNEWAEGAYLEPDLDYGRAFLQASVHRSQLANDHMAQDRGRKRSRGWRPSIGFLRSIRNIAATSTLMLMRRARTRVALNKKVRS